jgi:cytochrome b561
MSHSSRNEDAFIAAAAPALGLRYDRISILLHWITAALVPLLWGIAHTIDAVPKGEPRIAVRSLHIFLGAILGLVLLVRLTWRIGWGRCRQRNRAS